MENQEIEEIPTTFTLKGKEYTIRPLKSLSAVLSVNTFLQTNYDAAHNTIYVAAAMLGLFNTTIGGFGKLKNNDMLDYGRQIADRLLEQHVHINDIITACGAVLPTLRKQVVSLSVSYEREAEIQDKANFS